MIMSITIQSGDFVLDQLYYDFPNKLYISKMMIPLTMKLSETIQKGILNSNMKGI